MHPINIQECRSAVPLLVEAGARPISSRVGHTVTKSYDTGCALKNCVFLIQGQSSQVLGRQYIYIYRKMQILIAFLLFLFESMMLCFI